MINIEALLDILIKNYNNMQKIQFFIMALIIFSSCSKKNASSLVEVHINPAKVEPAYDIANDIEAEWDIVALETTDNCLISDIDKLIYQNGIYYLLDKKGSTVFLYDSTGKFISKLFKKGAGPDEYSTIEALAIVNKNIWVSDPNMRSLIAYNENLEMIDRYKTWDIMGIYDMVAINENICIATNWSGWNDENITCGMYDIANHETNGLLYVPKQDDKTAIFKKTNQLARYENSCLFIYSYCDTVFEIKDMKSYPTYKVVFTERYEDIPLPIEKIMDASLSQQIRGIEDIKQTQKNIFISYVDNHNFMTAIYNKSKETSLVYPHLVNSNIGNFKHFMYSTFFEDSYIISVHNPDNIIGFFSEDANRSMIKNESDLIKIDKIMSSIN
jgi:hypothetical protein